MKRVIAVALLIVAASISTSSQSSTPALVLFEHPGGDTIEAAVPDGAGGIWVTGTSINTVPTSADALQRTPAGGEDGFVSHIAADGTLLYATYLGGSRRDVPYGIARDAAGNLYVAGVTMSSDFPTTPGALQTAMALGDFNAFVAKLDPSGKQLIYSTFLGGSQGDQALGVTVDAAGVAHVVGSTSGETFPITSGRCLATTRNAFYVRISTDGSTMLFGACLDDAEARDVALDTAGGAYVVGVAGRTFGPRMNAVKPAWPTGADGQSFLAKFSGDSIAFSTYVGGSKNDWANAVAVTSRGIYIAGAGFSPDYPGSPVRTGTGWTTWIIKVRPDGQAFLGTALLDGSGDSHEEPESILVDSSEVVHLSGWTNATSFPTTPNARQPAPGGFLDAFYATFWMPTNTVGESPSYVTLLGGSQRERGAALALDGSGGVWLAGDSYSTDFPSVNAKKNTASPATVARFGQPRTDPGSGTDVVLYARDASAIAGNWIPTDDASAAGGVRLWNPNAGVPKIGVPAASPANYFELTFDAAAGVPHHLWLRIKAENDSWTNDSVWVQFSDSVDGGGNPIWRTGSGSAAMVSLEDCTGCGEQGWGWNDNGYDGPGTPIVFASSGRHTIRIQQREDGISIDQVVLSAGQWATVPPGSNRGDTTILTPSAPPPPPPPPPPTSDPREVVLYAATDRSAGGTNWQSIADASAAGGALLLNPDLGQAKLSSPASAGSDYFEISFNAEAGVPYHLWIRSRATNDYWGNDSVFVQFSGSVDASGAPRFRIGGADATVVSLEDCSGCGEQGWGWNDNGYGYLAENVYFATSGPQRIRVLRREDGISIDQIVLSAGRFLSAAPGLAKNDATIVPK